MTRDVRLSVIVPAYREAPTIAATIQQIRAELASVAADGGLEVVVVDDGSADGTAEASAEADLVVSLSPNQGKGAAVRAGMLAATGRTRVFTDADLSYAPAQIVRLLDAVEQGADMVVGNRHDPRSTTLVEAGSLRRLGGRVIHRATSVVLQGDHPDTQCGLKGFRSEVAEVLFRHTRIDGFAFDVELIHLAEHYGLSIVEVEVQVRNSDRSTVRVARDAVRLLVDLARIRSGARRGCYELGAQELALLSSSHPGRAE